jgi:hypothetical protein
MALMQTEVKICPCDGSIEHEKFEVVDHVFPDGSIELLPTLCPENDLLSSGLFQQYKPILKTLESNENWTNYACYAGLIAEITSGLYLYSFGDIDEVGESNFYIKSDLKPILDKLIAEWGLSEPPWREFLKSIGESGYPKGYQPGSMVEFQEFFPKLDDEGLTVGVSFNTANPELIRLLRGL